MEREQINEWIVRYNEGTLKGDDLHTFLQMLENDPELRKEVVVDQEINRMLEERDLLEFRKAVMNARTGKRPGRTSWLLLAAAIAVLLSIGGIIGVRYFLSDHETGNEGMVAGKTDTLNNAVGNVPTPGQDFRDDSIKSAPVKKSQLLAENFKPFPSLESLVGEATRADGITVEEPVSVAKTRHGNAVLFRWSAETPANVGLILLNNHGIKIVSTGNIDGNSYLLQTESLKPGLYYWKLLMNGQLVTVGKLSVE